MGNFGSLCNTQPYDHAEAYEVHRGEAARLVHQAISGGSGDFDAVVRDLRSLDRGIVRAAIHHSTVEITEHLSSFGSATVANIVEVDRGTKQLERLRALDGHLPASMYRSELSNVDTSSSLRAASLVNAVADGELDFSDGIKLLSSLPRGEVTQALNEVEADVRLRLRAIPAHNHTVQQTARAIRTLESISALRGHCPTAAETSDCVAEPQPLQPGTPTTEELFAAFRKAAGNPKERVALAAECSARCYERDYGNNGSHLTIETVSTPTTPERPQFWQRVPIHIRCFVEYLGHIGTPMTNKDLTTSEIKTLGGLIERAVDRGSCAVDYMDYHAHYAETGEKTGQGAGFGRAFSLSPVQRMEVFVGRFCFQPGRDSSGREVWVIHDTYDFSTMSGSLMDAFKDSVQARNPYVFLRHLAPLVGKAKPGEFHIPVTREDHRQLFNAETGTLNKPLAPIGYHHIRLKA